MLNQIKALLQDGQLRQKIKETKIQDEAIKLIATTAAEKGNNFSIKDVTQMLTKLAQKPFIQAEEELTEEQLEAIAGAGALTSN